LIAYFAGVNPNPDSLMNLFEVVESSSTNHVVIYLQVCPYPPMSRKRRAAASFEWNLVPDDNSEPQTQPDIRIQHSHLHLDQSGPSSSRTAYLSAPASPSKKAGPSNYDDDNYNWNEEPAPPEINTTTYPFLDPAYLHYLDVNEPGPPRRPRTVEVRT
jgi:hypothetical protein